ncbi:MAG TPA: hypothetical protein V6D19_22135 [Stenomitos sp.]
MALLSGFLSVCLSLSICLYAFASPLQQAGGWLIDATHRISSYRNETLYRVALEEITGYSESGYPQSKTLDSITFDNPEYISRGRYHCNDDDPALVMVLDHQGPIQAWTVKDDRLVPRSIEGIVCQVDFE